MQLSKEPRIAGRGQAFCRSRSTSFVSEKSGGSTTRPCRASCRFRVIEVSESHFCRFDISIERTLSTAGYQSEFTPRRCGQSSREKKFDVEQKRYLHISSERSCSSLETSLATSLSSSAIGSGSQQITRQLDYSGDAILCVLKVTPRLGSWVDIVWSRLGGPRQSFGEGNHAALILTAWL